MRLVSILIVTFALLLAGTIYFVVPRLMSRGVQVAQQQPARVAANDVLVAAQNLAAGTILKPEDLRWQRWPEEALDPEFLVREKGGDPQKDAVGRVVLHGFEKGEPVTQRRLLKPGEAGFLAAALAPGMRAVTIKIDAVAGAGGFILPYDRVDVLLNEHYTLQTSNDSQKTQNLPQVASKDVTSLLLRDVKVLAIDQVMQDIDSKPKVGTTATLEVDLMQAEKLSLAAQIGNLSLVLRSHTLPAKPESDTETGLVEDVQVSPYRAAVLQRYFAILGQEPVQGGEAAAGRHVYHGASLARETGQ